MEKPKPSELFTPEQFAAIQEMIASSKLSPVQHQEVMTMLARQKFAIFAGSSHPELAEKIANKLGQKLGKVELGNFLCGETHVQYLESVRRKIVFIVQTCREGMMNDDLHELYFMIDAALHAKADQIVAIVPHFAYAREDKIEKRKAFSPKVVAKCLESNGMDNLITSQLHCDQLQGFFTEAPDHIKNHDLFANYFKSKSLKDLVVVSTDAGGVKNCKELAKRIGARTAVMHKERPEHNQSEVTHVEGDVKGKTCVVYDDMVDTAGSVFNAKRELEKRGANPDIYLCATHPIFSGPAIGRLKEAKYKEVVVSDSLPLIKEKQFEGLVVLSLADSIAEVAAKYVGLEPNPSNSHSLSSIIEDGAGI
jgi:ribose-phosphate pyrophosphokinase